jgi:signal peptidase I
MDLKRGQYATSDTVSIGTVQFRVKLFPRGGGHRSSTTIGGTSNKKDTGEQQQQSSGGFGMSYQIDLPSFLGSNSAAMANEKVGIYLEYLPQPQVQQQQQGVVKDTTPVDATFALRLKGNQVVGRKFDLEWRAGMRFVPLEQSNLAEGMAHDFGAHLMPTNFLSQFLGIVEDTDNVNDVNMDRPVVAEVEITLHKKEDYDDERVEPDSTPTTTTTTTSPIETKTAPLLESVVPETTKSSSSWFERLGQDIRIPSAGTSSASSSSAAAAMSLKTHDPERVRVGKVVVPVLNRLGQRLRMFELGAYPGVEFRILLIIDPVTGQERFTSCPGALYDLKPIYPLVPQLERSWPVRVSEQDIPKLLTPNMYNAFSAAGSLVTAITGLFTAFVISQAISLFFIPSRSMDPTLQVGDVLLVDKITPRLMRMGQQNEGNVVLFSPPSALRDIVAANGGTLTSRDLFVKRIAAAHQGDKVCVTAAGQVTVNDQPVQGRRDVCAAEPLRLIEKYVKPNEQVLGKDEVFVLGDCSSVSIDSRVWGPLPSSEIVGRPIMRLWPLERFGSIGALPTMTRTSTTTAAPEMDPSPATTTTMDSAQWKN